MRRFHPTSPAHWSAGIAAALLLGALASHANELTELTPPSLAKPNPAIQERIRAFEAGTGRWSTDPLSFQGPDGRPVYLFTAPCCDHFNPLYDAEGRLICAPSGGFGGAGDGRCPAWVRELRPSKLRLPSRPGEEPWPPR